MSGCSRKPAAAHPTAPVGRRGTLVAGAVFCRLLAAVGTPRKPFGVVVCPRCRWPKGVELATKTSRCPRCGKSLTVARLKVWAEVAEAAQLPEAVGEVAAGLRQGPAEAAEAAGAEAPRGSRQRPRARTLEAMGPPARPPPEREAQTTLDPVALAVRAAAGSGARSQWEKVVAAVRELGGLQGEFTAMELAEALGRLGMLGRGEAGEAAEAAEAAGEAGTGAESEEALERWVGRLMEAGLVYAPRPGFYRWV